MLQSIPARCALTLADYAQNAYLIPAVDELKGEAQALTHELRGRKVWMVNSTAKGGGVAEMLPRLVTLLRELGVDTEWLVMKTERAAFFEFTKKLHNQIHGTGDAHISDEEAELYQSVSSECADALARRVKPGDIVIAHDPQPAAAVSLLREREPVRSVWRCHIGLDRSTAQSDVAWGFLKRYVQSYDGTVFSARAYVPSYLPEHAVNLIHPALDPLAHKNRELHAIKLVGILSNAELVGNGQTLTPPFEHRVKRLQRDGHFGSPLHPEASELLFRPVITQISRWDRLKGWFELLDGFVRMKQELRAGRYSLGHREARRLELVRLMLAGPEPSSVSDDPEAKAVLEELALRYRALAPELQGDVFVLSLPMVSRKQNALIVNALQRTSSLVVQNSLEEGFGLTVTEAMWKRTPVLGSKACGIRQQLRDGEDGRLIDDCRDPESVEKALVETLGDDRARELYARNAQRRVFSEFLVFHQVRRWLDVLTRVVDTSAERAPSV